MKFLINRKHLPLKIFGFILLLAITMGFVSGYLFIFITFEQERQLGDMIFGSTLDDEDLQTDTTAYLQERADVIAKQIGLDDIDIQVYHVESDTFNAYTLLGGRIVVYSALYDEIADSPEAIDMLLAHEMAHVKYRHVVQHMGSMLVTTLLGSFGTLMMNMETLRYSRSQEEKSDLLAIDTVYKLHGRLDGAYKLIYLLQRHGGADGIEFLSTHPDTDRRLQSIRDYADKHKIKVW